MSPRAAALTEETARASWMIDEFGNLWQVDVPTGCIRVRCENGHSAVATPSAVNRPCCTPRCNKRAIEISDATWQRMIAKVRREASLAMRASADVVDVELDAPALVEASG